MSTLTLKQLRKEQEGGWFVLLEGGRIFTLKYFHDEDHWHKFHIVDIAATAKYVKLLRNGLPDENLDVVFESRVSGTQTKEFLVNFDFDNTEASIKDCRVYRWTLFERLQNIVRSFQNFLSR